MPKPAFSVRPADFADAADADAVLSVRRTVFIEEQEVPESLEIDGLDNECQHAVAFDEAGEAIGTARLMPQGRIGRVAVLKKWRKRGVGAAMMQVLLKEADRRGFGEIELHAQTWTTGFYESLGFEIAGEEFLEAEIPHRRMVRHLRQHGNF
jgi:predicted GNAT family N-acyltransferase